MSVKPIVTSTHVFILLWIRSAVLCENSSANPHKGDIVAADDGSCPLMDRNETHEIAGALTVFSVFVFCRNLEYCPGGIPVWRVKATVNVLDELYPTSAATSAIAFLFSRKLLANAIRHDSR